MIKMGEEEKENPGHGLSGRVVNLEIAMSAVKTDLKWIKLLVAPTFLISLVSLLILAASRL